MNVTFVPQAASWLDAAPGGLEDCLQETDREDLRELLTNQSCLQGRTTATGTKSQNPSPNRETIKSCHLKKRNFLVQF